MALPSLSPVCLKQQIAPAAVAACVAVVVAAAAPAVAAAVAADGAGRGGHGRRGVQDKAHPQGYNVQKDHR